MKTYKDIYRFTLQKVSHGSWIHDQDYNFVFQFEPKFDSKGNYAKGYEELEKNILDKINGKKVDRKTDTEVTHKDGEIFIGDVHIITIRGWGNLTGIGAHNLPAEEAANIQDTFAEFIVDILNKK